MTRLDRFLRVNGVLPRWVSLRGGCSRKHLADLRAGRSEPTLGMMKRIRATCSQILRRKVRLAELFDLGEDR
jgi:hypothetical protein